MALNVWQSAKITSVFSPVGTHSNGDVKYSRQRFDVMRWASPGNTDDETWVVSPTADSYTPIGLVENFLRRKSSNVLDEGLTQDYGWYTADRLIIDSVGVPDAADEKLSDFHQFGPV